MNHTYERAIGLGAVPLSAVANRSASGARLAQHDPLLRLIDRQHKAVEEICAAEEEQRLLGSDKQATNDKLDAADTQRKRAQPRRHFPLLDSSDACLYEPAPVEADLLGQASRSNGESALVSIRNR